MCEDTISSDEKLVQLRSELSRMHKDSRFEQCRTMGEVTFLNIAVTLDLAEQAPLVCSSIHLAFPRRPWEKRELKVHTLTQRGHHGISTNAKSGS